MLTHGVAAAFRDGVLSFIPSTAIGLFRPELIGSRTCVPMAFSADSPPAQGQYSHGSSRVLPFQVSITMDQPQISSNYVNSQYILFVLKISGEICRFTACTGTFIASVIIKAPIHKEDFQIFIVIYFTVGYRYWY